MFSESLKGVVTQKFPGGFAPRPLKCIGHSNIWIRPCGGSGQWYSTCTKKLCVILKELKIRRKARLSYHSSFSGNRSLSQLSANLNDILFVWKFSVRSIQTVFEVFVRIPERSLQETWVTSSRKLTHFFPEYQIPKVT